VERAIGWSRVSSSVLAVVLLVAGNLVPLAGVAPVGSLLVLVGLKTALDLFFHVREHRQITVGDPLLTAG
jgi:hypothetical protein